MKTRRRRSSRTRRATLFVAAAALGVVACVPTSSDDQTLAPPDTDPSIELATLDSIWDPAEVCPTWNAYIDTGVSVTTALAEAVDSFQEGYGQVLTPAGRARLQALLLSC